MVLMRSKKNYNQIPPCGALGHFVSPLISLSVHSSTLYIDLASNLSQSHTSIQISSELAWIYKWDNPKTLLEIGDLTQFSKAKDDNVYLFIFYVHLSILGHQVSRTSKWISTRCMDILLGECL